ncbi:MAG TPA: hypothetical protein VIT23_02700 [Terrimicrobiaceae bacterium]
MSAEIIFGLTLFGCLMGTVLLGIYLGRVLPAHYLSAETKDAVKLAMGLVATMAALVLGLLVSSVKGAYDNRKGEVIQMAAKVAFIDRVLKAYGPETDAVRHQFREMVEEDARRLWPREDDIPAQVRPKEEGYDSVFIADQLELLTARDDTHRGLKMQAISLVMEFGQLRSLLTAQSVGSISRPMLIVVVCWLMLIFLSFSVLAPPNPTATIALVASTLSVAGAVFLILEMDSPFEGMIRISSEPMVRAMSHLAK